MALLPTESTGIPWLSTREWRPCPLVGCVVAVAVFAASAACGGSQSRTGDESSRKISQNRTRTVSISEERYRSVVKTKILPTYPRESIERKAEGVCVVAIHVSTAGKTMYANVLQSPDDDIGKTAVRAARGWAFEPIFVSAGERQVEAEVDAKLTFFFLLDGTGGGAVIEPEPRALQRGSSEVGVRRVVQEIGEAELPGLTTRLPGLVVVDVRSREAFAAGHREGASNIPVDELTPRSRELASAKGVVVDCYSDMRPVCDMAVSELTARLGVPAVWVVHRQ
jgi:TonB family protein